MAVSVKHGGFKRLMGDASNPTFGIMLPQDGVDVSHAIHIAEASDSGTDWAVSADTHPSVYIHSATTPESYYLKLYNDETNAYINGVGVTEVQIMIDGTAEVSVNATELELESGNYIQFLGNNGILDSAANEVILVEAVGTAVNYLNVKNAVAANPIELECLGTADRGFRFNAVDDEEVLVLTPVGTAVNYVEIVSAATGAKPAIRSGGTADTGLILASYDGTTQEEILVLAAVASAVNEVTITSAAAGNSPSIVASGSEDNIGLIIQAKGTGLITLSDTTSWTANGTGTYTIASTLPNAATGTAVTSWLTVKDANGSTAYIPAIV